MNVERWIPQVQLKKKEESMPIIWSLVTATESDALLFVDKTNSGLKHVNISSGTVDVLYRSSDTYSLRVAAFVADAQNRMQILLLVEMQPNAADKTMTYSLVVAELRNATWTLTQRFTLDSAPSALNDGSFASICAVCTNKVLCGVSASASLDVFSVTSAQAARKEAPVPLGFTHLCFTCGVCDGTVLLFACDFSFGKVHILEVCDGAPLALQLLRRIDTTLGGRLLWRDNGLLFCADWNKQSKTHSVRVWRVTRCGRRAELLEGTPITHADNMYINCWCLLGDKIAIFDGKTKDLAIYSCDLLK